MAGQRDLRVARRRDPLDRRGRAHRLLLLLHLHLVLDGARRRVRAARRRGEGLLALGLDRLHDQIGRPHAEEDVRRHARSSGS